jgi:hypothetical protein
MPAISLPNIVAGTANALAGNTFEELEGPALVSVWGSAAVAGGTITMGVEGGNRVVLDGYALNTEQNADEVNASFDKVLIREPVGPGKMRLTTAAQVTNVRILIEEA